MNLSYIRIVAILLLFQSFLIGGVHYYHPSSTVELGKPYDSFRPDVDVRSNGFFKWSEKGFKQEPGLSDLQFKYTEVESIDQLYKSLRIDINAEAKFGISSGKASFSQLDELDFSGRNLVIVVTAFREYKEEAKKGNLSLTTLGKERLQQAQKAKKLFLWRQVAGSEVVSSIVKGASTSIVYQFKTSSLIKKQSLKSALSATWSSGSANADFLQTAKSIDNDYSVTINYNQVGGSSSTKVLETLINSKPGDIKALRKAMSDSLKGVTQKNAKLQYFKTTPVDSIGDVVFDTNGEISTITTHFKLVIETRKEHFRRLMTVVSKLDTANEMLNGKPDNSFTKNGKKELHKLIDKFHKIKYEVQEEAKLYDSTNPIDVKVSLNAASSIPKIVPTIYFKPPFAKLAEWRRSNISYVRCGTKPHDCEFHDFYQSFYAKLQVVHPEFISRIRMIKNCNPVSTVRSSQLKSFIANGGNFNNYYKSKHKREGIYTWGANLLPKERNNSIAHFAKVEGKSSYILEVTDTEAYKHYINIGAYGKSKNSLIADITKVCKEL